MLNAIIGEAELDAGKYNYRFSFVSGDGFCVAKSTPEKGDVITFDIIKFSKLQTGL
jgi:spermidine synthase